MAAPLVVGKCRALRPVRFEGDNSAAKLVWHNGACLHRPEGIRQLEIIELIMIYLRGSLKWIN